MSNEILMAKKSELDAHIANHDNPHVVTIQQLGMIGAVIGVGVAKLTAGKLDERPINGMQKGDLFVSLSSMQLFVFNGAEWEELARAPARIGSRDLGFRPAISDDTLRLSVEKIAELEDKLNKAQEDLTNAKGEVRLLLDFAVNGRAELESLKDRVTEVEGKAEDAVVEPR